MPAQQSNATAAQPHCCASSRAIGHPSDADVIHPLIDCKVDYAAVLDAIRKAGYTEAVGLEYFPVYPVEEGLKTLVEQLSTY